MLKAYYELTKPGLVSGNLITTLAGFLFGSHFAASWLLLWTLLATALVIASACVFNNMYDRDADKKMARTKGRAFASGAVSLMSGALFAAVLALLGVASLFFISGLLPGLIALFGFVVYVGVYTPLKYLSPLAVFVGSIAGASPIIIGYTAATGHLDALALLLFLTLALWQIPHFYAIALYRRSDYAAAGIPVLSVKKGERAVYRRIVSFIVLYLIAVASLTFLGYAGIVYLVIVFTSGGLWFGFALRGLRDAENTAHARRIFFMSLIVMLSFVVALSFAPILP